MENRYKSSSDSTEKIGDIFEWCKDNKGLLDLYSKEELLEEYERRKDIAFTKVSIIHHVSKRDSKQELYRTLLIISVVSLLTFLLS